MNTRILSLVKKKQETDHLSYSSIKLKNAWNYTSILTYTFMVQRKCTTLPDFIHSVYTGIP